MSFQSNPYIFSVIAAGFVSLAAAVGAYQRRKVPGASSLMLLMGGLTVWMFAYAFELAAADLASQILFVKLKYLGIVSIPPLFFIFAVNFSQPGRLAPRQAALFGIVPLVILMLAWTNDWHGLIFHNVKPTFNGTFFSFEYESGYGFWAWAVYAYLLLVAGSVVLIQHAIRTYAEHRTQAWLLMGAAGVTWLGNIIYLTGNSPVPYLDITPFALIITALLLTWNLYRAGLFEIIPIAGENILESLNDAVIVTDSQNRVVMVNHTFEYFTKLDHSSLVGLPVQDALKPWPELLELTASTSTRRREIEFRADKNYSLFFDVRVSPIRAREGETIGHAFVLNDITERKQAERRLLHEEDSSYANQTDLIPVVFAYRQSDGRIVEANRTFIIKTGFNRGEVMGQSLLQLSLWTAEERATFIRELRDKGGKLDHYLLTLTNRQGQPLRLLVSAQSAELRAEKYIMIMGQTD